MMQTPSQLRRAVIACDVFQHDAALILEAGGLQPFWLEMGLHDQPGILRDRIQELIQRLDADGLCQEILLLYGACGNGLVGVRSGKIPLVIPQAHDCLSILLGGMAKHERILRENPGLYFYSPGWVHGHRVPGPDREAHVRREYQKKYPDDEELVQDLVEADAETFLHHDIAGYVELHPCKEAESYCQRCAAHLGWKFLKLEGDPTLLKDFLHGVRDPERFLVVPPHHQILRTSHGQFQAAAIAKNDNFFALDEKTPADGEATIL
ncbi:MAG: DUF1638 domain-containing protein [Terrimicrobiaceae bacterium]